jgi:hypothetical protein
MGGTYLRVLVTVGTLGVARFIPQVPEGGIWRLLPSLTPEGLSALARSISTVQVVADGSLIASSVAAAPPPAPGSPCARRIPRAVPPTAHRRCTASRSHEETS